MSSPLHLSLSLLEHSGTSGLATNQSSKSVVISVCIDCTWMPAFTGPLPHHSAGSMQQDPHTGPQLTAQLPTAAQSSGTARSFNSIQRGKLRFRFVLEKFASYS
jgi:hypothetical protein